MSWVRDGEAGLEVLRTCSPPPRAGSSVVCSREISELPLFRDCGQLPGTSDPVGGLKGLVEGRCLGLLESWPVVAMIAFPLLCPLPSPCPHPPGPHSLKNIVVGNHPGDDHHGA